MSQIPITRARLHRLAASLVDGLGTFDTRMAAYLPEDVATVNLRRQAGIDALKENLEDAAHILALLAEGRLEVVDALPPDERATIAAPVLVYNQASGTMEPTGG